MTARKPKAYCIYWKNIFNGTYGQIYTVAWSKEAAFRNAMQYLKSKMWHDVWIKELKVSNESFCCKSTF